MKISRRDAVRLITGSLPIYYVSSALSSATSNASVLSPARAPIPAWAGFGVAAGIQESVAEISPTLGKIVSCKLQTSEFKFLKKHRFILIFPSLEMKIIENFQ